MVDVLCTASCRHSIRLQAASLRRHMSGTHLWRRSWRHLIGVLWGKGGLMLPPGSPWPVHVRCWPAVQMPCTLPSSPPLAAALRGKGGPAGLHSTWPPKGARVCDVHVPLGCRAGPAGMTGLGQLVGLPALLWVCSGWLQLACSKADAALDGVPPCSFPALLLDARLWARQQL